MNRSSVEELGAASAWLRLVSLRYAQEWRGEALKSDGVEPNR